MYAATIRVLARTAAIQLEEVGASSPRAVTALRGKGKGRAVERVGTDEDDIGGSSLGYTVEKNRGSSLPTQLPLATREPKTVSGSLKRGGELPGQLPDSIRNPTTLRGSSSFSPKSDTVSTNDTSASSHIISAPTQASDKISRSNAESVTPPPTQPQLEPLHRSRPNSQTHSQTSSQLASTPQPPAQAVLDEPLASTSTLSPTIEPIAEPSPASSITSQLPTEPVKLEEAVKDIIQDQDEDTPVLLRASKVPSSRLGRLFHYGSLAASLSLGAATESLRRSTGSAGQGSVFMSDANVRRLVATLGRMRGAALKLGQFMSIQDNHMLPAEIEKVLQQVQAHANYMPDWQMERVMSTELGPDWQSLFSSFDRVPVASASIGQVHKGVLAKTGLPVAIKIQFPGIAGSINSDLANLSILIRSSALLPKGLYLQNTIAVMKRELEDECDYVREGSAGRRFEEFLRNDEFFVVPKVVDEATTGKVLTTEWMAGKPLSRMKGMSQETRDKIGTNILRLCLQELFHFRFMQTDPNWANFLYDSASDKVQLIDFGASREYTKEFMDGWYRLLKAALEGDRGVMKIESEKLGYLTGEENEEMLNAHLDSMALVASPFSHKGAYAFANQTITDSVRALIPIMLKYRLTPPPPETYSLNRKLSGAFLMCARLGANVDCQKLWEENVAGYKEG